MKDTLRGADVRTLVLFGLALCFFPNHNALAGGEAPNILILYADDLGFGDLGCYNPESKIPTTNLDAFARTAIRFTDGHSSSGICTPSRYALLTGRYHWRDFHGIVGPLGGSVFAAERLTLPEMLKTRGYQTAAIGKWHLGWDWASIRHADAVPESKGRNTVWGPESFDWSKPIADGPLDHGFDHYFGDTVINFPPYAWINDKQLVEAPDCLMDTKLWPKIKEGNWECRGGPMVSSWNPYDNIPTTTAHGVETIEELAKSEKPFFLYFAFPSPHAPIIPNDRFDGRSGAGPYGDFVVETDDAIGQLLDALDRTGEADNTIVIFTADNGPEKYAYARDEKYGHWSSTPLRGLKRDIYEGGHHVPFMIRWPSVQPQGRVCEQLVSQIDIMSTLAAIVGFDLPEDAAEDSHDLTPLLDGNEIAVRTTHVHNTRKGQYAIRDEDWLLVDAKDGYVSGRNKAWERRRDYAADDDGEVELYDLASDIGQRKNVAANHPEIVTALKNKLALIRQNGYSAPRLTGRK
ncbi:MAG TPA: arylsulfatase [Planctomycetaceae bacterium]|nr:arylsulfatase [Planctomycetaceae bacterium]